MHRAAVVAVIAGAVSPGRFAKAGGFGIPEVGVRRTAMAAVVGRPDDPSAIYHNPAGLVLEHGWQVYASFGLALLDTEFQLAPWAQSDALVGASPQNGYYAPVKPRHAFGVIPMLAATAEIVPDRLVLGAAVYVANATGASFDASAVTRYHLIDAYIVAPQAVIAGAYRFSDAISVGGSLGVIDVTIHETRAEPAVVSGASLSPHELVIDGSGSAPTWMIAAFGRPVPRVTWGATLTGRVDAALSGPIELDYVDAEGRPAGATTARETTTQLLPWAVMAGGNVDVTPNIELGSELRYWLYRQYKTQHVVIAGSFPAAHVLDTVKDYHDSWEASGGVRVHDLVGAPALELMAGTHYDRSPAPARTVTLDQPSFSHWGLHSGLRYQLGDYRLGASYIHYWYEVPTITDSITSPPTDLRGRGGNNIVTLSLEVRL